jgi:hypothetical protein
MPGWTIELEELKQQIDTGSPEPEAKPERLAMNDIRECPEVFQHRSGNLAQSQAHTRELVRVLRTRDGKPFDPITVFWVGDGWCCIDGHHRMGAYREVGHQGPIPVRVFSGTIEQAMARALQNNARDKLPMGREEKSNAAWRLVIATKLSKAIISRAAGVSERTVAYMRDAVRKITAFYPEQALDVLTWRQADRLSQGLAPLQDVGSGDWIEREAEKVALALQKNFKDRLARQPEVFARAIEIYDSRLLERLREWLGTPEEDTEEDAEPDF